MIRQQLRAGSQQATHRTLLSMARLFFVVGYDCEDIFTVGVVAQVRSGRIKGARYLVVVQYSYA